MIVKRSLSGIIFLLLIAFNSWGQTTKDPGETYTSSLEKMDINTLSTFFNDIIELSIPGRSGSFSSTQARRILENLFENKSCTSYTLSREGNFSDGSLFFLGNLKCDSGDDYRIYIVSRKRNDQWLIHILKVQPI